VLFLCQVLKVFPFPITITNLQFAVGGVFVLVMWATGLHKKPSVTQNQVTKISNPTIFS
jgi:solute carrier family 35 protein E1